MNTDLTNTYVQTVAAADSATAQMMVKAMAKGEGYRVRTVRSVRLTAAPVQWLLPRYRVDLAVER